MSIEKEETSKFFQSAYCRVKLTTLTVYVFLLATTVTFCTAKVQPGKLLSLRRAVFESGDLAKKMLSDR